MYKTKGQKGKSPNEFRSGPLVLPEREEEEDLR